MILKDYENLLKLVGKKESESLFNFLSELRTSVLLTMAKELDINNLIRLQGQALILNVLLEELKESNLQKRCEKLSKSNEGNLGNTL